MTRRPSRLLQALAALALAGTLSACAAYPPGPYGHGGGYAGGFGGAPGYRSSMFRSPGYAQAGPAWRGAYGGPSYRANRQPAFLAPARSQPGPAWRGGYGGGGHGGGRDHQHGWR